MPPAIAGALKARSNRLSCVVEPRVARHGSLLRNMFEQVLKTNDSLLFAVMTGCILAVAPSPLGSEVPRQVDEVGFPAKLENTSLSSQCQSIFTGLNNLKTLSVADVRFDEYFGFMDHEVRDLLAYYQCEDSYETVKQWYDGYQFGNVDVYCPWDVINDCDARRNNPHIKPQNYWINTSSNDAVKRFINMSEKGTTKRDIEKLVAGEIITKEIYQELTYQNMYDSIENIWSVLFTTGYLTQRGEPNGNIFRLAIPNLEIRGIFATQIMEYFKDSVRGNGEALNRFCNALQNGDAQKVEQYFGEYLRKTISIRDTFVKKEMKENFYHGILLGILGIKDGWGIASNHEAGEGYSDILIETENGEMGIIIEVKYAEDGRLEAACQQALAQIRHCRYEDELLDDGIDTILKYGIACYKKRCKVAIAYNP